MNIVNYLIARAAEPSTWTAGGVGFVAIHALFPAVLGDAVTGVLAAIGILGGALIAEKGGTK